MKKLLMKTMLILLLLVNTAFAAVPLSSWNDTAPRRAIINFVEQVTREGSPNFVPLNERIATFDNDGTLWTEQPLYFQDLFMIDRIRALAPRHPEWKLKQPFKTVLDGDLKAIGGLSWSDVQQLIMASHTGCTTEEFTKVVQEWTATAKHPQTGRLYTEMTYQPMHELLTYLRDNGFKTYMVTGGSEEFVRPWAEKIYGIPPEQVIGSRFKTSYELRDGKPVINQLPEFEFLTDNAGKPLGINQNIGRRPIASFGNSDGDLQMLQWTSAGSGLRFALLVHHTDSVREWAYDRSSAIGKLDKALDAAKAEDWIVVDMKIDWKIIHPFEKQ